MPRPRTGEAERLLEEVARRHNIDVRSLKERARFSHIVMAKREFIELAVHDLGLAPIHVAEILGLNHTTVLFHASVEMRERKKQTRTKGARDAQV